MTNDIINKELVNKIESLLKNAREKVVREVNNTLLITYMEIGKAIVEDEKLHIDDIEYENKSLRYLSKVLTNKFGKGFSRWNLNYMISFYQNYSGQTLSSHLGWSHYCELLSISDKDKRSFYEKECSNARMRKFYETYKDLSNLPTAVAKLPWSFNNLLIDRIDDVNKYGMLKNV